MLVELSAPDVARAARSAFQKIALAADNGHQHRRTMSRQDGYVYSFVGVLGELAVALATDLPWTGEYEAFCHDVGDLEVRSRSKLTTPLIIRGYELPRHAPTQRYVFCTVLDTLVHIHGWSTIGLLSRTWRETHFDNDKYKSFIVNEADLYPMETLLL